MHDAKLSFPEKQKNPDCNPQGSQLSRNYFVLLNCLESYFLQKLPVTSLSHKQVCTICTLFRFQFANAELSAALFSLVFHIETDDTLIVEEITNDHFSLCFAISITFVGKRNVHPFIKVFGQARCFASLNGCHHIIDVVSRLERE